MIIPNFNWIPNHSLHILIFAVLLGDLYYNFQPSSPIPPLVPFSPSVSKNPPARLAYYISGGSPGDGERLKRLLQAVYHTYNIYVVHLGKTGSSAEHQELFDYIDSHPTFSPVGNVMMYAEPDLDMEDKRTKIDNFIFMAALLNEYEWGWLLNLDASDYPLVTQDDLLHVLASMPRHLNFISQANELSREQSDIREQQPMENVIGLREFYHHLFSGSPWMALSHDFIEYCIQDWGSDRGNFLLNYHINYQADPMYPESYFQTIICNTEEFYKTAVNSDLRFTSQDKLCPEKPSYITKNNYRSMLKSNAPFARKFNEEHSRYVLDWIDNHLLFRGPNMLVPGGWCRGMQLRESRRDTRSEDPCLIIGNLTDIHPGPGVKRLQRYFDQIVHNGMVLTPQCHWL